MQAARESGMSESYFSFAMNWTVLEGDFEGQKARR
jgi:hypothetical protein